MQLPRGQAVDASQAGRELMLDLEQLVVAVCAPDVRAGDVWRTADGRLWHALGSTETGGVWLYPPRLTADDRPTQLDVLHQERQLVELVFRGDDEPQLARVGEADTAVIAAVRDDEEGSGG